MKGKIFASVVVCAALVICSYSTGKKQWSFAEDALLDQSGLFAIKQSGKWGFMDKQGKVDR